MAITQNSFNPNCLSVLFLTVLKSTCQLRWIQNMRGMAKSPADSIFYIFWPQNHLSRVQNSFLYVCSVQLLIQYNHVLLFTLSNKREQPGNRKKISCPSSQQLRGPTVHHDTLQLKGKRQTYISWSSTILPSSMLTSV